MTAPVVSSTSPETGDTTFNYRSSLTATFSVALGTDSVNRGTVVLYESASGRNLDIDVVLSSTGLVITAIPRSPLRQDTNHVFSLIGNDLGSPGGYIESSDGDALASTYSVTFRTTSDRYVSLDEVVSREDLDGTGPIRDTEDEAAVTGYLSIDSVTPAAFASNQSRTLSTIEVDFGTAVQTTGSGNALTVTMDPADGMIRDYGHQDATGKFLYRDVESAANAARLALITDPTGTITFSGTSVIWTRDEDYTFPYNAQITVQVHADRIADAGGLTLEEDTYFTFTTAYWPVYGTPMVLRIELGPTISQLYDDTLYRILFKNSVRAILESGDSAGFDRDRPYPNTERFVKAQSIIDVVDMLRFLADLQSGQTKTLGDFTVKYQATDPRLISKRAEAVAERDRALRELRRYRGNLGPRSVVKSSGYDGERLDYNMRTWDSLVATSSPVANTSKDRAAKANLRTDHPVLSSPGSRLIIDDETEVMVSGPGSIQIYKI